MKRPRLTYQQNRGASTSDDSPPSSPPEPQGAVENYDIVACRGSDGRYELRQFVDNELVMMRVGTLGRPEAAAAALQLAKRERSNAWIKDGPDNYRLVGTWK